MDYKDVDAEDHINGGGNDEDDDDYGLGPKAERNRKSYTSLIPVYFSLVVFSDWTILKQKWLSLCVIHSVSVQYLITSEKASNRKVY